MAREVLEGGGPRAKGIHVSAADQPIGADQNSRQKHVWQAKRGWGTGEMMGRASTSKVTFGVARCGSCERRWRASGGCLGCPPTSLRAFGTGRVFDHRHHGELGKPAYGYYTRAPIQCTRSTRSEAWCQRRGDPTRHCLPSIIVTTGRRRQWVYWVLPSPFSAIAGPDSLFPFSLAGVAVRFQTRAVS